jgi:serine/threonine protein phosphatase PrpC
MTSTLELPRMTAGRRHTVESPDVRAAVVSDRGRRRERNEDSGAVLVDERWAALIVCDGVGGSRDGAWASAVGTVAARQALSAAHTAGAGRGAQLTSAHAAAAKAVAHCVLPDPDAVGSPPSTTFVAAVSDGTGVAAISVGDSRAYWLPDAGAAVALTRDDSMAAVMAASGMEARGAYAHVITRWLGASAPVTSPRVTMFPVAGPGWLLACSDGLWNCLAPDEDLNEVVAGIDASDALAKAELLVAWANERGGHDNITVALARVEPTRS